MKTSNTKNANLHNLGEMSPDSEVILEAAWFAMRHHYQELAEYLDLSDSELKPIMDKLDKQLGDS